MQHLIEIHQAYSANHVAPYPLVISHGKGSYVYDFDGNAYLDLVAGIGVVNMGHSHPHLLAALNHQAQKIAILPRLFHNEPLAKLLQLSCNLTQMDQAIPMNSGAEAVETAIKVARKWAYVEKKVPDNQAEIIACSNSFHGRTITTLGLSANPLYQQYFGPLTPNFLTIPYNDAEALNSAITPHTAAFFVEPIQGEGGVILPSPGYLSACETICKKKNVLFIIDEIQTGIGRTGALLASQYEAIQADGVLLGKALGGGLLPISLFLAKKECLQVLRPGDHGSTFGGNPLAAAVAYETLMLLENQQLCTHAKKMGCYFLQQLNALKSPLVKEVRGKGLMIGIEINNEKIDTQTVFTALVKKGLLSINTRQKVIRLLPPLTINKEEVDHAIDILATVLTTRHS